MSQVDVSVVRVADLGMPAPAERMTRKRRWLAGAALGLLLAVAGAVAARGTGFSGPPAVKYRLATVETGSIVSAVTTAGTVKPPAAIQVGSQVSGQIKELLADFNSPVRQGQVIARLDVEAAEARLAQAEAEVEVATSAAEIQRAQLEKAGTEADGARAAVAAARAEVERAEAALRDADRELGRKRELLARGTGSAAERDRGEAGHDAARTQLAAARAREAAAIAAQAGSRASIRTAEAQLENALAEVKRREAAVRQIRIEVDRTVIRAPIDGVVIERSVDIGQTVAASLQAPTLFTIAPDLRSMEVHANVDEADIGRVLAGQPVSFTVDSFPDRPFDGTVLDIRKAPQSVQNVVAYTVVISAENDDLLLLPGMTANARMIVSRRDEALKLPNAALRFRPAGRRASTEPLADGPSPDWLLRQALDRADLATDRLQEAGRLMAEAGCVASPPDAARREACREAAARIVAMLSEGELGRYREARNRLAREGGTRFAEVWVLDAGGAPQARRVRLGVTDGLATEIVEGDLRRGDEVIVGAAAATESSGLPGL